MRIKHYDLIPDVENPFASCKLEREPYARILTDIVNTYADGFVLAINNEWGTGKTTFVKMWQQYLINEKFETVYFNAWENDFDSNPLVAIMAELKPFIKKDSDAIFKTVLEKGAVLLKNVAPSVIKAIAKKYIDIEEITDAIENSSKAATEILEEEIKEYTEKKQTIREFRNAIEKFIKKTNSNKPLVFIIDELDRCRPTYAVEVLEQMKHFFAVPGIVFVLSIDKKHLASSIKGYYGSEQINTDEYLRRFIDLEYAIPKPSNTVFCGYLFEYFSFKDFFYTEARSKFGRLQEDPAALLLMAEILFDKHNATLRQQEKIFAHTRLVLNLFQSNQYTFAHLLFFLIFVKTLRSELYNKIVNRILGLQELSDEFFNLFPNPFKSSHRVNLPYVEALLLQFYNNGYDPQFKAKLISEDANGEIVAKIKSKFESMQGSNELARSLQRIERESSFNDVPIDYLLDKINLTQTIQL